MGAAVRYDEPASGSHGLQEYPVLREAYEWFQSVADEAASAPENGAGSSPASAKPEQRER
jgi:hypothetical protein